MNRRKDLFPFKHLAVELQLNILSFLQNDMTQALRVRRVSSFWNTMLLGILSPHIRNTIANDNTFPNLRVHIDFIHRLEARRLISELYSYKSLEGSSTMQFLRDIIEDMYRTFSPQPSCSSETRLKAWLVRFITEQHKIPHPAMNSSLYRDFNLCLIYVKEFYYRKRMTPPHVIDQLSTVLRKCLRHQHSLRKNKRMTVFKSLCSLNMTTPS